MVHLQALDEFATKLIEGEHYASDDVAQRRDLLLHRRNLLYEKSSRRRQQLELSYQFQLFERDCDETKGWINEKLKTASDESYLVGFFKYFFTAMSCHLSFQEFLPPPLQFRLLVLKSKNFGRHV